MDLFGSRASPPTQKTQQIKAPRSEQRVKIDSGSLEAPPAGLSPRCEKTHYQNPYQNPSPPMAELGTIISTNSVRQMIQFFGSASPRRSGNWRFKIGHLGRASVTKRNQVPAPATAENQQIKVSGAEQHVKIDSGPLDGSPARLGRRWKTTTERGKQSHYHHPAPCTRKL